LAKPWTDIDRVTTPDGELVLRQRGDDFMMTVAGRVLMTSAARRSEEALGQALAEPLSGVAAPRVLIAGLGLGYTLRSALDVLPDDAAVTVAELNPVVVAWCKQQLAGSNGAALDDPRVTVEIADVAKVIERAGRTRACFDAILLDLYLGPDVSLSASAPFYGRRALHETHLALRPGGMLGVWAEDRSESFERGLERVRFRVTRKRAGRGGRRHCLYLAFR